MALVRVPFANADSFSTVETESADYVLRILGLILGLS
jgi:hypothetical protein